MKVALLAASSSIKARMRKPVHKACCTVFANFVPNTPAPKITTRRSFQPCDRMKCKKHNKLQRVKISNVKVVDIHNTNQVRENISPDLVKKAILASANANMQTA